MLEAALARLLAGRALAAESDDERAVAERELQVARLVVDRRTNREIAAEPFVSLKTVEAHMRNLFRKLDVSSRAEVARVVERVEREPNQGERSGSRPDVRGS